MPSYDENKALISGFRETMTRGCKRGMGKKVWSDKIKYQKKGITIKRKKFIESEIYSWKS